MTPDHCVQPRDAQHERRRRHRAARLAQLAHAPREQRRQDGARDAGNDEEIEQVAATWSIRRARRRAAAVLLEQRAEHRAPEHACRGADVVERDVGRAARLRDELVEQVAGGQRESRPAQARQCLEQQQRSRSCRTGATATARSAARCSSRSGSGDCRRRRRCGPRSCSIRNWHEHARARQAP